MPALPGPSKGVPGPAGGPGAARPSALPPRERALQPHDHVRAGVVAEHAEETGPVGVCGDPRGGQFQHAVPQAGVNEELRGNGKGERGDFCWWGE